MMEYDKPRTFDLVTHVAGGIALLLLLAAACPAEAQAPILELDVDGVMDNGPDHVAMAVGDTLAIDVWVYGEENTMVSIQHTLCADETFLQYLSYVYFPEYSSTWTCSPIAMLPGGCVSAVATQFNFGEYYPLPVYFGIAYYRAWAPTSLTEVAIDSTGYFDWQFNSGSMSDAIGLTVEITDGTTSTQTGSWSAVKELFR